MNKEIEERQEKTVHYLMLNYFKNYKFLSEDKKKEFLKIVRLKY